MPLTKEKKKEIVKDLNKKIEKQKSIVFVDFTGLKVKEIANLRRILKKANNELKVAKKTLINIAFKDNEIEVDPEKLEGEIALVFGYEDEVSPSKIVYDFSKNSPHAKIIGGILENKYIAQEEMIRLAQLPSREQLLGKLVYALSAPKANFVYILNGNLRKLVYILSQIK